MIEDLIKRERAAQTYRSRWRWLGAITASLILLAGAEITGSWAIDPPWLIGAGLDLVTGVIMGHIVYRRKAPL